MTGASHFRDGPHMSDLTVRFTTESVDTSRPSTTAPFRGASEAPHLPLARTTPPRARGTPPSRNPSPAKDSLAMRKIVYTDQLEGDAPYVECQVGGDLVFIVNTNTEPLLEPWAREEMWNRIFHIAENPKTPVRQRAHDAEIIDIEDLRARRHGIWRVGQA